MLVALWWILVLCEASVQDRWSDNLIGTWTWLSGESLPYTVSSAGTTSSIPLFMGGSTAQDVDGYTGYVFGGQFFNWQSMNLLYKMDLRNGTWIRLSTTTNALPAPFGNRGVAYSQSSSKPTSRIHSSFWNVDDMLYIFGGTYDFAIMFNDMWTFNVSSLMWTWVNGNYSGNGLMTQSTVTILGNAYNSNSPLSSVWPPARFRSISWTFQQNSSLFFIGGHGIFNDSTSPYFNTSEDWWQRQGNDIWRYDIRTGFWHWISGSSLTRPSFSLKSNGDAMDYPPSVESTIPHTETWEENLWLINPATYWDSISYMWFYNSTSSTWISKYQMQSRMEIRISNSVLGTLVAVGSNLLILYGGYNADDGWSPSSNALYSFEVSTNLWNWIEGNSSGPAVFPDSNGYYPSPMGVANHTMLPAPGNSQMSFTYDNKIYVFGGIFYPNLFFDATFLYEVCGNMNSIFANGTCISCQSWEARSTNKRALDDCELQCPLNQVKMNDSCVGCPAGEYPSQRVCTKCLSGYVTSSNGSLACRGCVVGSFANVSGLSSCLSCSPGFYSSALASTFCSSCTDGSFSESNASTCDFCPIATFSNAEHSNCSSCPLGSITKGIGAQSIYECLCDQEFYGYAFLGQPCNQCSKTPGISCAMVNLTRPMLLEGFYRDPMDQNSALNCIPNEACQATTEQTLVTPCSSGYTGYLCGDCVLGEFYRQGIVCTKCASKVSQALSWIAVIAVGLLALVVASRKVEQVASELKILIFWIQIISIYPSMSSSWPPILKNFLQLLSGANFDIQITSPGGFVRQLLFVLIFFFRMLSSDYVLDQVLLQNVCSCDSMVGFLYILLHITSLRRKNEAG
jgi:hypothetical protein